MSSKTNSRSSSKQVELYKQRRNLVPPSVRKLFAGGLAGVVTKTSTAPLERIKILMQVSGMASSREDPVGSKKPKLKYRNILQTATTVTREEGVFALWRGNGANCVRVVPVYAMKFTFNDFFRDLIRKPGQSDEDLSIYQLMLCGTASGMFQQAATFPLEFVRTRLSLQDNSSKYRYKGVVDCIRKTVASEGVFALYKGLGPTMVAGSIYVGLQMTFYTRWKYLLSNHISDEHRTVRKLLAGSLAGVCAQTITYPGDTIRRRMIANGTGGMEKLYKNSWDCLKTVIRKEGIQGFFRGATANLVRSVPGAAIQFYAYDLFSSMLISD